MKKLDTFTKMTEEETLEKLTEIGWKVLGERRALSELDRFARIGQYDDEDAMEVLSLSAKLARLSKRSDELVRNREIKCPCGCGSIYKMSELTIRVFNGKGEHLFILCPKHESEMGIKIEGEFWTSFYKILDYAHVPYNEIFAKVV